MLCCKTRVWIMVKHLSGRVSHEEERKKEEGKEEGRERMGGEKRREKEKGDEEKNYGPLGIEPITHSRSKL